MYARIAAVRSYFPAGELSNEDISAQFPEWSVEKIADKTGIFSRHIASEFEFTSELATRAAERLFDETEFSKADIDYVLLCTQSPDYFLPTTACLVHENLGLRSEAGAADINLGCSGYIYALGHAKGLIESGQVNNVLLITADTWSKFINPNDKSVRTIFGDAATATLVTGDSEIESLRGFSYGTDGSGAGGLIVPRGGLRNGIELAPKSAPQNRGLDASAYDLYMDGPEVFNFTLRVVPEIIQRVLNKSNLGTGEIDYFVFHQANRFMLEHLRNKLAIPAEKFPVFIENCGNTISSTIPIVLEAMTKDDALVPGTQLLLAGFGVGLSWGGVAVTWSEAG